MAFKFQTPSVPLVFGLACNIERTTETLSGFRAKDVHGPSQEQLFGQPRLADFAAMLKSGFTKQIVFLGAAEKDDGEPFQQGDAMVTIVEQDYGAPTGLCRNADSGYGTNEAASYIRKIAAEEDIDLNDTMFSTSHYHVPRFHVLTRENGLLLRSVPAEAFYLLDHTDQEGNREEGIIEKLIDELGGNGYAKRTVNELIGISRMVAGLYRPQGNPIKAA